MIGTPDDSLISGFDTPAIVVAKELGIIKSEAQAKVVFEAMGVLQQTLVDTLYALKKSERGTKTRTEEAKNKQMTTLKNEGERQSYLFQTYVPALRQIGLSKAKIQKGLLNPMQAALKTFKACGNNFPFSLKASTLAWVPDGQTDNYVFTVLNTKFTLLRLYKGSEGFSLKIKAGDDGCVRDVYSKKLGKLSEKGDFKKGVNEYVKDDNGIYTRRWAWGYKTLGACEHLMGEGGVLKGRYAKEGKDIKGIDAELRQMYKFPNEKANLTTREVLFVNQEKGSGDQQRGVCLTSSPDKLIHGNKGETFAKDKDTGLDNILLKVDLAKVPKNQELLFNLYTQEAQALTIGLDGSKPHGKGDFTAEWAKWHTDTSTAKNREIYLRELTQAEVANADDVKAKILALKK